MTSVDSQLNACVAAFTPPVHAIPLTRERSRFSSETGAAISGWRTSSRAGSWVVTWRGLAEGRKETASSPRTPSQPARQRFVRGDGASARAQQAQPAADESTGMPPEPREACRAGAPLPPTAIGAPKSTRAHVGPVDRHADVFADPSAADVAPDATPNAG